MFDSSYNRLNLGKAIITIIWILYSNLCFEDPLNPYKDFDDNYEQNAITGPLAPAVELLEPRARLSFTQFLGRHAVVDLQRSLSLNSPVTALLAQRLF